MKTLLLTALLALSLAASSFAADPTPPASGKSGMKMHSAAMHKTHAKMTAVDLNAAAKEDLVKVQGITDEIADKIIAARPLTSKHDLVAKKIVTQAEFNKIKNAVMVKPAPKSK